MDWSKFIDPQILLGVGAFTAGVINAYWNHRQHQQDATGDINNASQEASEHQGYMVTRSQTEEIHLIPFEGFINDEEVDVSNSENAPEQTIISDEIPHRSGSTRQKNMEGERISTSQPPKASSPPPTSLSTVRNRLEDEVMESGDFDFDLRKRGRRLRFREKVKEEVLVSNADSSLMTEQKNVNRDYVDAPREEEDDLSDSSGTITSVPTENLLDVALSELKEQELVQDDLEDVLHLQVDATNIYQIVSSYGLHHVIIPEHPLILAFIPYTYNDALTISNVTKSYQSNLPLRSDLTPINICPRTVSGGYADISALIKTNLLIYGIDSERPEVKLRHSSSSSSSRTSEASYLSAEEDTSLNDDLFYDPMRMELTNSLDQSLEWPLKHEEVQKSRQEVQPNIEPLSTEHEAAVNETPISYHSISNNEKQNIVPLYEKRQAEASEISRGFDRSVESLLLTEDSVKTESSRRLSVRFNDTDEIHIFGDDYSDGKTSNDGSDIEDEVTDESNVESYLAPELMEDLKTKTEKSLEATNEKSPELSEKVKESSENLKYEKESFTDKHSVGEIEPSIQVKDISAKYDVKVLDEKETSGLLEKEISSPESVSEEIQLSKNTEFSSPNTNMEQAIVDASLGDSQETGKHKLVPQLTEAQKENQAIRSQDDQQPLCFNLGFVQVHDSFFECAQENAIQPDISLNPIFDESQFHDQISIGDTIKTLTQDKVLLKESWSDSEQVQDKSLEPETTYENLSAKDESSKKQIPTVDELIEEIIQRNTESVSEMPKVNMGTERVQEITDESFNEFNANLYSPPDLKSLMEPMKDQALAAEAGSVSNYQTSTNTRKASLLTDEKKQAGLSEKSIAFDKTEESSASTSSAKQVVVRDIVNVGSNVGVDVAHFVEDTDATLKQAASTDQQLSYGTERTNEKLLELAEELTLRNESSTEVKTQREPMKDQVQIGESESNIHFDDKLVPSEGDMAVSESQNAGTSEKSSAFDNTEGMGLSTESNIEPALNKSEAFGDIEAVPTDSALKPSFNDSTVSEGQKAGTSEMSSAFDIAEGMGLSTDSNIETALSKNEASGDIEAVPADSTMMPSFNDPTINDTQQAGSSEVVPGFSEEEILESKSKDIMESTNVFDGQLHYATEQMKENEFDNLEELNIKEELIENSKSKMQPIDHKNITEGEMAILQFEDPSTKNRQISVDDLKLAGSSEISPSFVEADTVTSVSNAVYEILRTATLSDSRDVKPPQDQDTILLKPALLETAASDVEVEISKDNEILPINAETVVALQSPISPQDLNTEGVEEFSSTDSSTISLQLKIHPANDLLPQCIELQPLEQTFNLIDENYDFEEVSVQRNRESTDGRLTTIPVEIVTTNETKLELEHSLQIDSSVMSEVRRHSVQLRKLSSHFSLNLDAFDNSESFFDTWSEKSKPRGRRYYASFGVDAGKRRETSPELMNVEEDEVVECLDADNPDRWVVEAAAPYRSGRLATICLLEKPVASHYRLSINKNPREKFREEVLTISNKKQECLMKRRHALTDLAEEEEGYQFRIKKLRNTLERLEGVQLEDDNKVPLPEEMIKATKGMLPSIDKILELSETSLPKFQACIVDPPQAANHFTQNESQWAEYSSYLYHLNLWMQSFKNIILEDNLNILFCLTSENGDEEGKVDAQLLLEYLFAPRTHLSAYEHLLSSMARYSSRANQDTRGLEEAITALRKIQRRTNEALKIWPYVSNMPDNGSLGVLPNKGEEFTANSLPNPIIRKTLLKVNNRKGEEKLPENTQEGFLILDRNYLMFIKKSPDSEKKREILWKLPLENVRLRTERKEMDAENFEIWDISNADDPIKCVYTVNSTSSVNQQAWIQDIQRAMKNKRIADPIADEALIQAHKTADAEHKKKRVSIVEDTPTDVTDGITDSYYDAEEMTKSRNLNSEAAQQAKAEDDETSLTYYTAEGSIMQLAKQDKPRPDSMLSIDSVNTLDGVTNPFMEQILEQGDNVTERNEVVYRQAISTGKPIVHHSEVQEIDSSEGGEMELTIETSTSDSEAYTTEWTFNGFLIDSDKMGAYPRVDGNAVYLLVPKVSRESHEGRYECTLSWPSGMKAIFPFDVTVHEMEDDIEPTNETNKLKLKKVEVSKISIANEAEESSIEYHEVQINGELSKDDISTETVKSILLGFEEPLTRHRASVSSIITIEHELSDVSVSETTGTSTKQEKIYSSEVPQFSGETTTSTQPFVQEYSEPNKLKAVEGDPFKITASGRVDSSATIFWTLNGRKILANVFEIKRRHSAVELTKSAFVESDSGEYTLWVDGKAKANFLLTVEKPKEEPKLKEDIVEDLNKNEVSAEKVEKVVEEKMEKSSEEEATKASPKESKESSLKDNKVTKESVQPINLQLSEDDDFKIMASIPLDARRMKSDRFWWTKNGKSLIDVDGVTPRNAIFLSKSSNKSLKSTDVQLVKKGTVTPEDAAVYVLLGEPRVKLGFKNQETAYATIIVSVVEKRKEETEISLIQGRETKGEREPLKETTEVEKPPRKSAVDEAEPKGKESRDETDTKKPKKKKSIDESDEEKRRKKSTYEETEEKPKKKKSVDETGKEKPKKKRSRDESVQETPEKRKSISNEAQKVSEEIIEEAKTGETLKEVIKKELSPKKEEEERVEKEESPKAQIVPATTAAENIIKLKVGDKFELKASVPLDSRQMKNDRLWWTKDGKPLTDVDGVSYRGTKFNSKSNTKLSKSADIELFKKEPVTAEDAATYKLMGEPRIKRGFKSQETTYATFVVSVEEQLKNEPDEPLLNDEKLESKKAEKHEAQLKTKEQKSEVEELKAKPEEKTERKPSIPSKVDVKMEEPTSATNSVNITEGDKFQLIANIPLDSRQLKSDKLWWTKNGKPLIDVNIVAPRTAKFTSKSANKSTRSSEVELIKKDPASIDDTATYVLIGEPRVKRGFRNQETKYATIEVIVTEKPKDISEKVESEVPAVQEEDQKSVPEPIEAVPEIEKPHENEQVEEAKPKKKRSKDEASEEKPKKKKKSIDESSEKKHEKKKKSVDDTKSSVEEEEEKKKKEESKPVGERPKEEASADLPDGGRVINLKVGDRFELLSEVPLDTRQLKNEKLWWTKDGKQFIDVDGIAPRSATFAAKSTPKPPKSTNFSLTKKDPAALEDSATYVLMGEPKVKRDFKSQATTYSTIFLRVEDEKPAEAPEEFRKGPEAITITEEPKEEFKEIPEPCKTKKEIKPEETGVKDQGEEKKVKRKKKKSLEGMDKDMKKKPKKKEKVDDVEEKSKVVPSEDAVEMTEEVGVIPIKTTELRCIEANANRRLGHDKIPIPSGEPLCLTVTGIPPDVASVEWTLNGQPVRSGKRVQRLLEPNPLGKRFNGELMAQLYLDSTALLDSGNYELTITPTDMCPISANLKIPVEIISARKDPTKRRGRVDNQMSDTGAIIEDDENVLQVQPDLCLPLGFAACEGQPLSLIADLNVPLDQVPPESVSWSRNGIPLSRDDPANDFRIKPSDQNHGHTSVILYKPAVTLDDVGFYSVSYNPLPAIQEEPLAEAEDEEGYGVAWEVDFPELLVFPAEKPKQRATPVFTKELPTEILVSEGDTITLETEVAEPTPGITPIWSVNGHDIDPARTSEYVVWDSGNYFALTIPAASRHQLGEYKLRLTSDDNTATLPSTSCRVRGKVCFESTQFDTAKRVAPAVDGIAPMFTKKLADLDCSSGDSMELTCRVVGDPIPHFFWRHNGEIVANDDHHRIRTYDNTSTLKILSVEPKDRGVYICSAVNELGKTQTAATVTVDGKTEPYEESDADVSKYRSLRHGVPRMAPDGLMLESSTPTDLTICWTPVISEDGSDLKYTVEMSKDKGYFWSPVLTGLQTNRAVLPHTIASPLQPIQLRVLAENALGTGPPSQPVLKIPARATVPNVTAVKPLITGADLGSVMISWTDPAGSRDDSISYIVEVREGTRSEWKPIATGLKDKTYVHHLKPGVSTMVRIRAYNEFGTSEPSATAMANLPVENLIPDLAVDPPWVSVIRPDVHFSEKSAHPGLMLYWKEAYLPDYCDDCVRGLKPIYTLEWRKGRTGPWQVIDDCISDTTSFKLPSYIYRAVQDASNYSSQTPEIRVVCRNDYGSTLPTKSLRLTDFGMPKQNDLDATKPVRPEESLFTLPIMALPQGVEKRPLWLTSMDVEDGISLKWEEFLFNLDGSPHGKYRVEYAIMPNSQIADPEGWWKPIGPGSQPILGDSYCLDLPLSAISEQRIRLLALSNDGTVSGWLNGYRQLRIPSKRQLLPSAVEGLRARVHQPKEKEGNYSVRLDWSPCGQTEGEQILSEQLEDELYFQPTETTYRIEVQEGHGVWREIGSVIRSSKTFFEHRTPLSGSILRYRVIPINRYGEGSAVEAPAVQIPKKLTELHGCVEDLKALIVAPQSVFLRWRLGDEAIDALESMGRRVPSTSDSPSRMGDSGYEDTDWRGAVRYCVQRRDGFSSDWYPVANVDSLQDELTGKVILKNCPKEMYGNEYRVIALLNGQPCAPSRPVRINIKSSELTPDLSYQKAHVNVGKVDEYLISYPEEKLEAFFSHHILASTLPQSIEEELTFDVEAKIGNGREWEKIATGLSNPSFAWGDVNPLIPYSFRIVGRNQFGVGLPSRTTHVDAQVVIPDLSFVIPTVWEPSGILEGREPPELKWQTPRAYSLTQTLTPFTYEVQVRSIGGGSSDDWKVFKEGLKQPKCSLEDLDPTQEYALRVVAVTTFGKGEPSQQTRKRKSRAGRSSMSMSNYGSLSSSYDSIPPQFENPSPEVVYVPTSGDLDLRCTLASYNLKNPVQFIWSFNFQEIPNLPKHEQFPSGYFQHVTGGGKSAQLRLFDLDERDFGTYTCKAVNAYGSAVKEFRVIRADAPVITEVPLPIITLPVHHTLLLPCCVDAVPPAKITWTRDSKRLTSSYRTWIGGETGVSGQPDWSAGEDEVELGELTVDASLRVERCVFQDAGLYTMIAENPAGRAQTSCIVRIEEKLTPRTITPRWSNIDKHYFVLHKIATGSFSRSHLLIDKKTSREYVGKIYALEDPMTRVLGAREFECLNRLHHNNVVEMVDAVVSDDHLVLVTERLSGNHLLEEVLLGHTWTEKAATMLIKELLEAVVHIHEEGIIHLDIQPDNIIFPRGTSSRSAGLEGLMQALSSLSVDTAGAGGRSDLGVVSCFVKLTGFSMAQPVGQRQGLQIASIMPPALWCPDFAAPELLKVTNAADAGEDNSEVSVGFAADVWSIGVIAYLLLFGEHPVVHSADTTLGSEERLSELASSVEEFEKDVSPEAIDFLRHSLAIEPSNRPTAKECLRHPWFAEGSHSTRNLENSLNGLISYQRIYQKRKTIPTEKWRRESFLRFAGRACIEATPFRRSITPALLDDPSAKTRSGSVQPRRSSIETSSTDRGYSIDRDLTSRITTLMVPPEERIGGGPGSGASSLRSSMLHLDIEDYQTNQSPLDSPSPRLDPWRAVSGSRSPSLLSADDSSEPIKRMCNDISKERDEQILPVEPHLCEGPIKSTNKLAPVFANPLRDSQIDPVKNSVYFSCQISNPPRLPAPEILYQRGDVRKDLKALGLDGFDLGGTAGGSGGVAAAWYLSGCLLSEAPGISLGAEPGGWLWLKLDDAERGMAGKVVECVIRARTGKAKTRARILLPEPPNPPGRPGLLKSASTEVLVGWSCGNHDSCEDLIYRVDVKYPDAKPVASAWRTVGYTVDRRFLIVNLESDLAYRVRVCVRNAVGWSPYSIASSEFRLHSDQASKIILPEEERDWILQWRQAAHPFGLSDHPEAMSANAISKAGDKEHEAYKRPPPSGVMNELVHSGGLFPHLEAIKMLCRTEGLISKGAFGNTSQLMVLLRCHPALVERGNIPNQRSDKQPIRLPAFMLARITRLHDLESGGPLEVNARQQALLLTLLRSAAATTASAGLEGAPLFTQQFGVRTPSLLPQSLCLGWMANDAAKPTAGVGLSTWIPGGPLLDVLLARGEYTEFSVARWVHQLLSALRWLHTAFHGRLHGRVDFDNIHAARRTSSLPDIVLTGVEPIEPFEKMATCFTASELDDGSKCNALSDLWSVGAFAYFMLVAESYSTSMSDRQSSRTPTPTGSFTDAPESEIPRRRSHKSSVISLPGGYRQLSRPLVNIKMIKKLSRWGRRFVYNTLQVEPISRGSLDFWLENDWFSLKADVVKQLTSNTIPSKYLRIFRQTENLYGVVPLFSDETDPLLAV